MTGPYRVGNHNARHVYRGDQEIAVAFTEDDGRLIADALNAATGRLLDAVLGVLEIGMPALNQDPVAQRLGIVATASCTCPLGPEDAHFADCPMADGS